MLSQVGKLKIKWAQKSQFICSHMIKSTFNIMRVIPLMDILLWGEKIVGDVASIWSTTEKNLMCTRVKKTSLTSTYFQAEICNNPTMTSLDVTIC